MVGFTGLFALHTLVLAANPAFGVALHEAQLKHQPLLVLVGAEWCPACQTMKHQVIPGMARRGGLRTVSLVTLDADADAEIARQLMRGGSIPQLIIFSRKPDGQWHREQLTGASSESEITLLIARALKAQDVPGVELAGGPIGN